MNDNIFSDEYFMNEAIKEANKALHLDEVPVGAIIVCENNIIARSHNYSQTLNDATAHAEMQAFTSASDYLGTRYLNKCTLYVWYDNEYGYTAQLLGLAKEMVGLTYKRYPNFS